jgi:hypothetical protein
MQPNDRAFLRIGSLPRRSPLEKIVDERNAFQPVSRFPDAVQKHAVTTAI